MATRDEAAGVAVSGTDHSAQTALVERNGGAGKTRIVILGGGAGGLELASQLATRSALEVVLVDHVGSHLWKPRLHEFAAGTVSSTLAEMSFYILGQMRGFRFEQGTVTAIDHDARTVILAPMKGPDGEAVASERAILFDLCVVALGGTTPDFGTMGVAENAVRLEAKVDADRFRSFFIGEMIGARESGTPADVVIVGSGATGTELAAHLRNSERAFFDQTEDERRTKLLDITILEAAPVVMPGAEESLRRTLLERLKSLDIKVVTDAKITAVNPSEVRTASGECWPADIVVWAAGLVGNPVLKTLGRFELDKKGRIKAERTLVSTVDDRIYVLGDSASVVLKGADEPLPPTAQVASQQAHYLAEVLPLIAEGKPVEPFEYSNKGRLISLGRAGTIGTFHWGMGKDILIHGQFAIAAYRGLQREHQWRVLGPVRGTVAIAADMISPTKGPALKLHGG